MIKEQGMSAARNLTSFSKTYFDSNNQTLSDYAQPWRYTRPAYVYTT